MERTLTLITTYWNRKKQLQNTLRSIAGYGHDVNIIIVDDCSTDGEDIHCFETDKITVIRLDNKKWVNPCIPFNIGFSLVKSDIVIIQNAECLHIGDVVGHALVNAKRGIYLSYCAFSIDKGLTDRITAGEDANKLIAQYMNQSPRPAGWGMNGWYNHPAYRPAAYHFCSAIMRDDLYALGGFDERYAKGSAYDDDDFICRVRKMGMRIDFVKSPMVVHQHHEAFDAGSIPIMMNINYQLFDKTKLTKEYDAKPYNKIYK